MRWRWFVASGMAGFLLLAACGGELDLPDQGECPPPPDVEIDDSNDTAYKEAVRRNLDKIRSLEQAFREAWPERRIRVAEAFREDYARYAHLGRCTADVLLSLEPPEDYLVPVNEEVSDFASRYREALDEGGSAVASRNGSAYSRWADTIDELEEETRQVQATAFQAEPGE